MFFFYQAEDYIIPLSVTKIYRKIYKSIKMSVFNPYKRDMETQSLQQCEGKKRSLFLSVTQETNPYRQQLGQDSVGNSTSLEQQDSVWRRILEVFGMAPVYLFTIGLFKIIKDATAFFSSSPVNS